MVIAKHIVVAASTTVELFTEVGAAPAGAWKIRLFTTDTGVHIVSDDTATEGVALTDFGDFPSPSGERENPVSLELRNDRLYLRNRSGGNADIYALMVV